MTDIKIEDNGKKGQFEIYEDGKMTGLMTFTWVGKDKFIIDHTEVKKDFEGKGYAKELVMAGIEYARKKELKIIPLCPYAKLRFERDKSTGDVLA